MIKRLLFLLMGGFMVISTASADCVKCDSFGDCNADVSGTACSCTIRVVGGKTICRESGFCSEGCGGGGVGPVLMVKPFYLEESALSRLSKKEPLLSTVIAGSIVADAKGKMRQLMTDSYDGGTIITENAETFHHRGSFAFRASGDLAFRFSLENLNGQEKIEYVGTISSSGRHIQFSKIRSDEAGNVRRFEDGLDLVPVN
jgi:hypothetical protein